MDVPILRPAPTDWACPNCSATDRTYVAEPHVRFHTCPGLRGLSAPFVRAGKDCRVFAVEREDYVNGDLVQTDGADRPVMSVVTEYADGRRDCAALAPAVECGGQALTR